MENSTFDIFLLIIQAFFWTIGIFFLWRKNRFYSLFAMVLYLYLLPTEITYRFYPEFLKYYWGIDTWYKTYWYINFSLLTLLLVLNRTGNYLKYKEYRVIRHKKRSTRGFILLFMIMVSLIATYLFITNIEKISYQALVQNGADDNADMGLAMVDGIFKNFLPMVVILPIAAMINKKWYIQLFLIYNLLIFYTYHALSGSRSDILAVTLALVLLWMYGRRIRLKQIVGLIFVALAFLFFAGEVFSARGGTNEGTLAEKLLNQDYTAPAINVFAVIGKDVVDPLLVLESQLLKALPLIGGDWMYIGIGEKCFPATEISASQSMGFHPFTEGYLFASFLGFLYNGIVVGLGLALWNRFMSTNDEKFNRYMFAVMGCVFFALVRAQSIWFVRYIYFSFLPAAFFYSQLCNVKVHYWGFFRKSAKRS